MEEISWLCKHEAAVNKKLLVKTNAKVAKRMYARRKRGELYQAVQSPNVHDIVAFFTNDHVTLSPKDVVVYLRSLPAGRAEVLFQDKKVVMFRENLSSKPVNNKKGKVGK